MSGKVKIHRLPRSSDPIGVFDSGVGGLSILAHLRKLMPHERFIFLADQSYVPYGAKSPRELKDRSALITRFFQNYHAKLIVVACNTATCYAIDYLRKTFSLPFIGTVPAVKPACRRSKKGTVAVLSTPATAKSPALKKLIQEHSQRCTVLRIGCAGLEEAVEQGSLSSLRTQELLSSYLSIARKKGADQIVLGCTHYPFLVDAIKNIYPVATVDSGNAVARHTRTVLHKQSLERTNGTSSVSYWTTGNARTFSKVASRLLSKSVHARHASI